MSDAQWAPDPTARHELRYFDGAAWTEHVSNQGAQSVDALTAAEAGPVVQPAYGAVPGAVGGSLMPGSHLPVPAGTVVSSRGRRFLGALLGALLMVVTLVIGYAIWALIIYDRGQTPAKQLMKMRVIKVETGRKAGFGDMFLRGFVIDGLLGQVTFGVFGLVSALWIFGDDRQRLTDKMVKTIVVDDPQELYG